MRVVAQTLLYPDFLAWCAGRLIAASTPDRETELDGALVQSGPPSWRQRTIDKPRPLSWVSPSCSASGRRLVATAGAKRQIPFGAHGRANLDGGSADPTFIEGLTGNIAPELPGFDHRLYFSNDYGSTATIARATLTGLVQWDFITGFRVVGDLTAGPA